MVRGEGGFLGFGLKRADSTIVLSYVNGTVCAHKVDQCCYVSDALMSASSQMHFITAVALAGISRGKVKKVTEKEE